MLGDWRLGIPTHPAWCTDPRHLCSVVTSTVPATVTVSNPSCVPTALAARAVTDNSGLSDFVKEAISLACTCLHLAPTVTTTRTLGLAVSSISLSSPPHPAPGGQPASITDAEMLLPLGFDHGRHRSRCHNHRLCWQTRSSF